MNSHFYASVYRWLLRFITLQLFISLMSLSLLIAWGLPLSMLSPVGNSLFNPLLTLFLLISTLVFMTELVYLPNQWLCWLLEKTDTFFVFTGNYADSSWLIGIRQLPLPILFTFPIIGLWIILTPRLRTQGARALALAGTLFIIFMGAYFTSSSYLGTCNAKNTHKTTVIAYADHTLVVFDYGMLTPSFRYRTWWEYSLMAEITKKTGKTSIDYLICLQPSEKTLEGIAAVASITQIRHLVIVSSPEKLHSLQEELISLKTSLKGQKNFCTIQSYNQKQLPHQLTPNINYSLNSNPQNHTRHIKDLTINCDKQSLTINPSIHTNALAINTPVLDKQQSDI